MTEVFDYDLTINRYGQALWRQCEAEDFHPWERGFARFHRCGGVAMRGVTYEHRIYGTRYTFLVCDAHTLRYAAPEVFVEPAQ